METFEIIAKKNKKQLTKKIIIWSTSIVIIFFSIILLIHIILGRMATNNFLKASHYYENRSAISYPNISYDSAYNLSTGQFNGLLRLNRTKDIDGIQVPYDVTTISINPYGFQKDITSDGFSYINRDFNQAYGYGNLTKIPLFFNKKTKGRSKITPPQEISLLGEMPNQVVEVAITFDKEYTYKELKSMLPSNLKVNWYWLGTESNYDITNVKLSDLFGLNLDPSNPESSFEYFYKCLGKSIKENINGQYGDGISQYDTVDDLTFFHKSYKKLSQAKFSGVILTGKSENFVQLDGESWIYASSIGALIPNQPYYKLDKE